MLGRKNYTQDEIDHGRSAVEKQLAMYGKLVRASKTTDKKLQSALEDFEGLFFNDMTLVLDRYFVPIARPEPRSVVCQP
jgi:hypothetical protein